MAAYQATSFACVYDRSLRFGARDLRTASVQCGAEERGDSGKGNGGAW